MVGARSVLGAASVMGFESRTPAGGRSSAERGGHTVGCSVSGMGRLGSRNHLNFGIRWFLLRARQ